MLPVPSSGVVNCPHGKEICIFGKSQMADGCYFKKIEKLHLGKGLIDRSPQN